MISKNIIWSRVVPVLLFTPLFGAVYRLMFAHIVSSGTSSQLRPLCTKTHHHTPFLLTYTNISVVDRLLCSLVTVFHTALAPENFTFTSYMCLSLAVIVIIPFVEATRQGRPSALAFPLIVGLLTQLLTAAFALSGYFLLFVLSGAARMHTRPHGHDGKVSRAHAKATLYGHVLGMAAPTAVMLFMDHAYITAIWQPYPVFFTLIETASLFFSTGSERDVSGYIITQATYLFGFIASALAQFTIVLPRLGNLPALRNLLLPSISILDPTTTTLEQGVIDFLKWDGVLCIVPCMLATFWFASNVKEVFVILAWHIIATLALGPGAAIAGIFMWREYMMNGQGKDSEKHDVEEKKK